MRKPKIVTLTVSGAATPEKLSQFLHWMAEDVQNIRAVADGKERSVSYAFDPDSDYVEATTKRKVSER